MFDAEDYFAQVAKHLGSCRAKVDVDGPHYFPDRGNWEVIQFNVTIEFPTGEILEVGDYWQRRRRNVLLRTFHYQFMEADQTRIFRLDSHGGEVPYDGKCHVHIGPEGPKEKIISVIRDGQKVSPRVPAKAQAFFDGVGIPVITARLPFQKIEGAAAHNDQMDLMANMLSLFGGSFAQGVQAVLQACDHGLVDIGEKVIAVTGDSAAVITASTTGKFLTRDQGLAVHEIICKPRNLTIARGKPTAALEQSRSLFEEDNAPRLKAAAPRSKQLVIDGKDAIQEKRELQEDRTEKSASIERSR
jgi:hypothetical protein